jgi:hypothetical protein
MTLDSLVQKYRQTAKDLPAKDRALLELDIYSFAPAGVNKRDWAANMLGVGTSTIEQHRMLLKQGGWCDALWRRIDDGMALSRAVKIAKRAVELCGPATGPDVALHKALKEFGEPASEFVADRRHTPEQRQIKSKEFAREIDTLAREYAAIMAYGAEPHKVKNLTEEFTGMVRAALEDFRDGLNKARALAEEQVKPKKIGKRTFEYACEVLGLRARFGKPLDMAEVKRRKNRRALDLHEDRHQHLPEELRQPMRQELERVLEAYSILDTYSDQQEGR